MASKKKSFASQIRDWIRQQPDWFTLGEAMTAFRSFGSKNKSKDAFDLWVVTQSIIKLHDEPGPRGGAFAFSRKAKYIGKEEEERRNNRMKETFIVPSFWDKFGVGK